MATERHGIFMKRVLLTAALTAVLSSGVALAQTVTGGIYGQVPKGETVKIKAINTGVTRSIRPSPRGRFSITALSPGQYRVEVLKDAKVLSKSVVTVRPGLMSPAPNAVITSVGKKNTSTLGAVTVNANTMASEFTINPIDTQSPQLVSHFNMKLVNDLPTNRSPESIALLKSSVTYDQATTGSVELNGATAAENRYYLDGFDITNNNSNIGSFVLPAEAVASTNIIDGNFDASWTDATGGVLASTVKEGSNVFKAGYDNYFTPSTSKLLRPIGHETFNSIGQPFDYRTHASHAAPVMTQSFWGSGPIIKNKLFAYVLFRQTLPRTSKDFGATSMSKSSNRDKTGLANITWNITNHQTLNMLGVDDKSSGFSSSYQLNKVYEPSSVGRFLGWSQSDNSTKYLIGNYNGQFGTNFAVHLMAGAASNSTTSTNNALLAAEKAGSGGNLPPCATVVNPVTQIGTLISPDDVCRLYSPTVSHTRGYKADFTWWLGNNKIQWGAQYYHVTYSTGYTTVAAGNWTYYDQPGIIPHNGSVAPDNGKYVQDLFDEIRVKAASERKSAYIQDSWQATDKWLIYGGVRWDDTSYTDADGQPFMALPFFSPRIGFAWDVNGDSTFKIGGGIGRYSVAMPTNYSADVRKFQITYFKTFTYTGRDKNGAPTGKTQVGPTFYQGNGPTGIGLPIGLTKAYNDKAPEAYSADLYAQIKLTPAWSAMAVLSGTSFKRLIAEECDEALVTQYAQQHGFPNYVANNIINPCYEVNPGRPAVLRRHFAGNDSFQVLKIPASALETPKPKHHYYRLTLSVDHIPTRTAPYYLNVGYTFARDYGNVDGLLDLEHNDAGFVGRGLVFAYPEIAPGSNGNLADDIRNSFVASGVYYFHGGVLGGLHAGGIFRIRSGAPWSCLGTYPSSTDIEAIIRNNKTHYCNGIVVKRGLHHLPWEYSLDIDVGYDWQFHHNNKLAIDLKVQNLTNHQSVIWRQKVIDYGQFINDTQLVQSVNFRGASLQAPRTTMLVLRYQFN